MKLKLDQLCCHICWSIIQHTYVLDFSIVLSIVDQENRASYQGSRSIELRIFPPLRVDHLAIGGREPFRKANIIELVSPGVEASAGWVFLCIGAGIKGTRAWLGELITRSRHRSRLACHRKLARTRGTRSVVGSHPRGSKPRLRGARNATSWTWCNDRMQPWRDVTFARFPANAS